MIALRSWLFAQAPDKPTTPSVMANDIANPHGRGRPRLHLRLFRTLVERCWHDLRFHALAADLSLPRRSYIRELWWDIGQRDILFQKWRVGAASDVADLAAGFVLNFIAVAGDAAVDHFESDQSPLQSSGLRFLQCGSTDEVWLFHL